MNTSSPVYQPTSPIGEEIADRKKVSRRWFVGAGLCAFCVVFFIVVALLSVYALYAGISNPVMLIVMMAIPLWIGIAIICVAGIALCLVFAIRARERWQYLTQLLQHTTATTDQYSSHDWHA